MNLEKPMTTEEDSLFDNASIDVETLPDIDVSSYNKLSGGFFWVMFIRSNLMFFALCTVLIVFMINADWIEGIQEWAYFIGFLTLLWVLLNVFIPFGFKKKGYALRERDIIYKSGLWWTKIIVVPFNRIQHCEVQQGPVSKVFALKSLTVFTAGGGSSDLKIGGLPNDKADQLKEFVLTKIVLEDEPSV